MSDGVKMIFKTLLKIPAIIAVSYIIFNIIFMLVFYFKFLGLSYTVMQTCMESNFIPERERVAIQSGLDDICNNSNLISNAYVAVYDTSRRGSNNAYVPTRPNASNNRRTQYGSSKTIGIHYDYTWIWPLMPQEYGVHATEVHAGDDIGNLSNNSTIYNDGTLNSLRESKKRVLPFDIYYTVPGLQYYADLD